MGPSNRVKILNGAIDLAMQSPRIEVLARMLYRRSVALQGLGAEVGRRHPDAGTTGSLGDGGVDRFVAALRAAGVQEGDTLIVHSGNDALQQLGLSPAEVNGALIGLLGAQGTLVIPAFPLYRTEQSLDPGHRTGGNLPVLEYRPRRTATWTGLLGLDMVRRQDSSRSRFPLNSLVAVGLHAANMFAKELEGEAPTPCGPNSAWKYCADLNAKILMIGVDVAHSLTMGHVAEDAFEDEWPVRNWYRFRDCLIIDGTFRAEVRIRERQPKWAAHLAQGRLNRDLRKAAIVEEYRLEGVALFLLEAQPYLNFLRSKRPSTYPYYLMWCKELRKGRRS